MSFRIDLGNCTVAQSCVMYRRVERISWIACFVGEILNWIACFVGKIISRMACSREGNLAYLWERTTWGEIVWLRMDNCEAKGIQTQSSSVNCSPCPVSLRGRVITMVSEFRDR